MENIVQRFSCIFFLFKPPCTFLAEHLGATASDFTLVEALIYSSMQNFEQH